MWSLKEEGKDLAPKIFSNRKTQEDIVKEVLDSIKGGNRVIFIRGACGSGKSAIALNIAKELGRASIIVPIKTLQKQYESDYLHKKQVYKEDGKRLSIKIITGRNNHPCRYLDDRGENKESNLDNKQEILGALKKNRDAKLYDIFKKIEEGRMQEQEESQNKCGINWEDSADNPYIPCKIEIKEKNIKILRKYYNENPGRRNISNLNLKFMRRLAVAPACPYWSPIFPEELKIKIEADKINYMSINGEMALHQRKPGCHYYGQFKAYIDADVMMFNSAQYLLELALGRKPATEIEIIDECDEFLDKLSAEGVVNLNRLRNESKFLLAEEPEQQKIIDSLNEIIPELLDEAKKQSENEENFFPLKGTKAEEFIKLLAKNDYQEIVQDEDSYIMQCSEIAFRFYELIEDSYIGFYKLKDKEEYGFKIVTVNLDKVFNSLLEKNKILLLMSGTIHSEKVLKEIFGIKDFKVIEAEAINQGSIIKVKTGMEADFSYQNFSSGKATREQYLKALDKCVGSASKPAVIHISAFSDMPTSRELQEFGLKNLIDRDELIKQQKQDKHGKIVQKFKQGEIKILFTTKCSRGIDFPYETCNSVIITKFPYPHVKSLFWKILKKQKPGFYWDFYRDKAHRELLQRIYRSVRAADDRVELYSPDLRVLESKII